MALQPTNIKKIMAAFSFYQTEPNSYSLTEKPRAMYKSMFLLVSREKIFKFALTGFFEIWVFENILTQANQHLILNSNESR